MEIFTACTALSLTRALSGSIMCFGAACHRWLSVSSVSGSDRKVSIVDGSVLMGELVTGVPMLMGGTVVHGAPMLMGCIGLSQH